MRILDFIELWVNSLRGLFESMNISVSFSRTEDDRPNHSCSVTIRRDDIEIDFIAWASGHGELAVTRCQGDSSDEHLEGLANKETLTNVLATILKEVLQD